MASPGTVLIAGGMFLLAVASCLPATTAQEAATPSPSPSPAPAPSPGYVNLTHLLALAGPFTTFLRYLEQTDVIDTFQNQANNTEQGSPSSQLRSLLLFHALPQYYSLEQFKNLSQEGPTSTFAGGQYTLNFTYSSGLVRVFSSWANPSISSSIFSTAPVALYQVKRVLLPEAIFGAAPPAAPAPAPSPESGNPADLAPSEGSGLSSPKGSPSGANSSPRQNHGGAATRLVLGVAGG
ncbi:unnamed protein product [Spirodela intermedia]|uniref:FAS1 domain-containing protein n=1 Tax=Spirodela intermedia TaxID=51605 RepID=A0A7I8JKX1_SPIIN|nr:unnamed protein product [Spirodela intermedia]CAA6670827.1 unnamed protein product [Spirodela intermedia]